MKFRVDIQPPAYRQLMDAFDYLYARSPRAAEEWLDAMFAAIFSLETSPARCTIIHRAGHRSVHQLLCGTYRIFFIVGETVQVIGIYHQAQQTGEETVEAPA